MQNVTDQIAQSEPAKNVAITTPGLTLHALTRPPVRPQSHIYSNISPKLGSKTFESLPFETLYQNSVKFQTLPHRSSSAKSSFELSPDSPPSRLPRVESRDLHPSVLLAELSHIYSIPKKEPANTSAAGCSRDYEENSKQPPGVTTGSALMACSFVPSQCESTCAQILQGVGQSGQDLGDCQGQKTQKAKNRTKCPLCGLEGHVEAIQTHQSKCSLANKNWTNHNAASVPITSSSLTRSTLSDAGKTASYANGTSVSQYIPDNCNQSVTSGGSLAGTQSRGAPRSIPRAKSSDTFEHAGVRTQLTPAESTVVCSSSSNQLMASSVNNTGVNPGGGRVQSTPAAFGNLEPLIGNGYGSLFAKLEMLDKSMENSESPDEHVDHQSAVIVPCIFKDAGCHFQGSHFALSRHLEESTKLHLAMTYSVMQHQQKQLLMVTSALAAAMNPNTDGNVIWKIRNFGERLMEAKSGKRVELQSAVFYSSRFGYKLTLLMYPDGFASAKGSHISIFLKVLRGDFDSYLQWPFPHTVKIAILSQDQSRQHIVQRVNHKFNIVNESNSATSPSVTSPRSSSIASSAASSSTSNGHQSSRQQSGSPGPNSGLIGLSRFVSQELILSSQQYLMDETLAICASVMSTDNNNNFRQPEVFPRTSEI
ncbi:uncharacterized protein LOC142341862 isoform X3 [Convolutriloba macropyga]|uniref:uncharacterized protein LOC142341862 isoform X3 n=1 Tax=Convolutriloba macropyga TaxID=536237 RepID=UPI003F52210D